MISGTGWLFLALLGSTASAASLPLRPGSYGLAGTACSDPAFAATFDYDGQHFSYPHATRCTSVILSHKGRTYHVSETCSALGDGSAARPDTTQTTYTVLSATRVRVSHGASGTASSYHWCGPLRKP